MSTPNILAVWRTNGVADQYAISAKVHYHLAPASVVTFVSNTHGGPIVMVTNTNGTERQTLVSSAVLDRIGHELTEDWVRAFFAPHAEVTT